MPMGRVRQQGRAIGLVIALAAMLAGCDYWPPALQTQIEQLRSELQTVTMEKAQLQTQLASLGKVKDDLQIQVDELTRTGRDKSSMIASLQSSVSGLQERLAKASKPSSAKMAATKPSTAKPAAKPVVKTAQKAPVKKKTLAKSSAGR